MDVAPSVSIYVVNMASITIYFILSLSVTSLVSGLSCITCDKTVPCPLLPKTKECFKARAPCACCDNCASRLGDECGALRMRCHPDYVCVNTDGVEKVTVPWYILGFKGTCRPPGTGKLGSTTIQPVVIEKINAVKN